MRACDGIFSVNFAGAWREQQDCGEEEELDPAAANLRRIRYASSCMTASMRSARNFSAVARKFSGLLLDNARAAAPEKISARHEISTEAVDNFWITQA
jgi:hypothetical protein